MRTHVVAFRAHLGRTAGSLAVSGALLASPAMAQGSAENRDTSGAHFTLADAATIARRRHPLLLAASGRRLTLAGTSRQESAIPNPTFEWRKENYGSPLPRDEFLSLGMPVDFYGRRLALSSASGLVAARALADSASTARVVEYEIARAYWHASLAFALRDAATAQRLAVDTIALIEAQRAQQGQVPQGSALRARLEADRARLVEANARADVERARGDLARALAIPLEGVPRPTESLRIESDQRLPSVDALRASARATRSDLRAARARADESSRRELAERLGIFPAVGMQFGRKRTSGLQTGTAQIGVAIPLFDRNSGNRQRAHGDVLIATGELRAAELAVDAEVGSAFLAYLHLLEEYGRTANRGSLGSGSRDLAARGATVAAIAGTAYREGAISLFELLDAERVRAEVRIASLRAAADLHLARLELMRAIGLPIDAERLLPQTP